MVDVAVRGLAKTYGENTVVDNLDLTIPDGQFVTLLGPSGCGKTTTLRCIAGLETPDRGLIEIGGQAVFSRSPFTSIPSGKRDIGMVFQSYALWPHMTVQANIAYPLRRRRWKSDAMARRVEEMLETVSLAGLGARSVGALSGGQQQRVALARALAANPGLMLFDEPLSNLDARLRQQMRTEVMALHARTGTTSLYVTHDQVEAITMSDVIVVMDKGRVRQIGSPTEVYEAPRDQFVAEFMGFENILAGTVADSNSVELPGAIRLRVDAAGPLPAAGSATKLAVRANHLEVSTLRHEFGVDINCVAAVVGRVTYLGESYEMELESVVGRLTAVVRSPRGGDVSHQPGDQVVVKISPHQVVVLAEAG